VADASDCVKPCTKCGEVKPFSNFRKDKKGKFGLTTWCRGCLSVYNAAWYAQRVASPEGRSRYNAEAQRYKKQALAKQPTRERARKMFYHAQARAMRRGLEFAISLDAILATCGSHCPILGIELEWAASKRTDHSPTLDRLDNAQGYVLGNVLVMSWRANRLKSDGSAQELRMIADFVDTRSLVSLVD
jgi:hypothetical protein